MQRQGARQRLRPDLQHLLIDELQGGGERPEDALPLRGQGYLAVKAPEQQKPERLFQGRDAVAHRAWAQGELVGGEHKGAVAGRRLEGVEPGELMAAEQLAPHPRVLIALHGWASLSFIWQMIPEGRGLHSPGRLKSPIFEETAG